MLRTTTLFTCLCGAFFACGGESAGDAGADDQSDSTSEDSGDEASTEGEDSSGTDDSSDSSDTGDSGGGEQLPPTDSNALLTWLADGEYTGWAAESGPHPSDGPHFGNVRTFLNAALDGSFEAGADMHPAGSAAVKELYGDGGQVLGWSVSVKLDADSAGGDNWYWYEKFNDTVYADGAGDSLCTGCHSGGKDFVLSPYPLQ